MPGRKEWSRANMSILIIITKNRKKPQESVENYSNHGRNEERLGSPRPYAGSTLADTRTRVAAIKDPKWPSRGVALEASRGRICLKLEHNFGSFSRRKIFNRYFWGSWQQKTESRKQNRLRVEKSDLRKRPSSLRENGIRSYIGQSRKLDRCPTTRYVSWRSFENSSSSSISGTVYLILIFSSSESQNAQGQPGFW